MTTNLSDNPRDKLKAALNHDRPDNDLGADYREACAAWFAGLSERERAAWLGPRKLLTSATSQLLKRSPQVYRGRRCSPATVIDTARVRAIGGAPGA